MCSRKSLNVKNEVIKNLIFWLLKMYKTLKSDSELGYLSTILQSSLP